LGINGECRATLSKIVKFVNVDQSEIYRWEVIWDMVMVFKLVGVLLSLLNIDKFLQQNSIIFGKMCKAV